MTLNATHWFSEKYTVTKSKTIAYLKYGFCWVGKSLRSNGKEEVRREFPFDAILFISLV